MPKTKNEKVFKDIGNLIKLRREELGCTQTKLGEFLGVDYRQVQKYEKGDSKIAIDYLSNIAKFLKVSISYFFPENKEQKHLKKPNIIAPAIPVLSESFEAAIDKTRYKTIPVYSYAGAGKFIDLTEIEPIDTLVIPREYAVNGSVAVVKVIGRSMEPTIMEGAYIGIDKDSKIFISGNIYAVYLPYEGAVIKKVYLDMKNIILKSENKDFPDIIIPLENIDNDNFIIGKVKWVLQKF